MDTHKIKAILASAKCGSFSRAAEEFSYTPSAFSHMMSSLEKELGVKIFNRSRDGVTLTAEGKALVPKFEALISAEGEILDACADFGKKVSHTLRIGTYSSIMRNYLSEILSSFREKFPNINIFINVADDLSGWLEQGRADIVFANERFLPGNLGGVFADDVFCVIAPQSFVWEEKSIPRDELYRHPHVLLLDEQTSNYLEPEKFSSLIHLTSEDDTSVFKMVRDGMGLSIISKLIAKEFTDGIKIFDLDPPLRRRLCYVYSKSSRQSFALREFVAHLKEVCGEPG